MTSRAVSFCQFLHPGSPGAPPRSPPRAASSTASSSACLLPCVAAATAYAETYRLIGRAMVKCVLDGAAVPDLLAPSVYKYLLGEQTYDLRDLEAFHPAEARKLRQILAGETSHAFGSSAPPLPPGPSPGGAPGSQGVELARRVSVAVQGELEGVRAPALAVLRAGFAEVDLTAYLGVFTASDLRELITSTAA